MRRPWIRAVHAVLSGLLTGLLAAGPAAARTPLRLVPQTLPAAASGAPRVLVLAVPLDAAARAHAPQLALLGEQAVAPRFEAVDLARALDAEGVQARATKADEAAAAFKEGKHAYDEELDPQKALPLFDVAARAWRASDLTEHFGDLSRARVMRVAAQLANGETKAAQLEVEKVLAMDPKAEFPPNYFPPDFIAFVERTRKAVLAEADGTLVVKTGGVPARVYVDGQLQGVSPVTVSGLTRADHAVTALASGYALAQDWARDGEVDLPLQPTQAAARLQAVMERIGRDADGPGRDAAAQELGKSVGAQQVLVLLARGGSLKAPVAVTAVRLDVADGHSLGHARGSVPVGDGMAGALGTLLAGVVGVDAPRVGGRPVKHFGAEDDGAPSPGRRTAGYVLLTTGAALLAGGVYFGLEASSRADRFKLLPQTDPRAERIRSEGKTFALVADVGMVLGLASAGAGTYLAFFGGGKKAAAVEPEEGSRPAPKPAREPLPMPPPPKGREPATPSRAEEDRKAREEATRREQEAQRQRDEEAQRGKREGDAQRQREEEAAAQRQREEEARRKQEAEAQRQREEEARRQREAEEQRKREEAEKRKREEEKKKRRSIDEDDLRNY